MDNYTELNPREDEINKEDEARVWEEIGKIDGVGEYLRSVLSRDMKFHFTCPKDQQDMVRGAFYRTEYFSKLLKKHSVVDKTK